jgi:deazaflavin-dependent oxidoreductase (nitroreductase family)
MAFDTRGGTRGVRSRGSAGRVSRWVRQRMISQHRRKGGKFMGMDVLFLTTIGTATGARRMTPVAWFPDGQDAWLIVASAAGAVSNPQWYRNIAARPDQVWIEFPQQQKTLRVAAEQLEDDRREQAWQGITKAQPRYAKYQLKTDRVLPVIRLIPAESQR